MTNFLLLVLIVQIILLVVGLAFLIDVRGVIKPRSVWWSFVIRDLLWILLAANQAAILNQNGLFPFEVTIILSTIIVSLFLFSIIKRYQAHRQNMFARQQLEHIERALEDLRAQDEAKHHHDWNNLPRLSAIHPTIYYLEAKQ